MKLDHVHVLAVLAASGILAACQEAQSPHPEPSAEGGAGAAHEVQVREPTEKHSCGDHGH